MVNFAFPKDAVEALDDLARGLPKKETAPKAATDQSAKKPSSSMMSFAKTQNLFTASGLDLPAILVKEKKNLLWAMKVAGKEPYTLKAMSPDIIHKTDAGAVKLNIRSVSEMHAAWDEIEKNVRKNKPGAVLEGMLVQTMEPGKEIIVGMKRDPLFGPTILFGLGGIFTEAFEGHFAPHRPSQQRNGS